MHAVTASFYMDGAGLDSGPLVCAANSNHWAIFPTPQETSHNKSYRLYLSQLDPKSLSVDCYRLAIDFLSISFRKGKEKKNSLDMNLPGGTRLKSAIKYRSSVLT